MEVPVSLLNKKISEAQNTKQQTCKIYIEDYQGNSYSTKVLAGQSVEEAIGEAVINFNQKLQAGLPDDPTLYELYPAKAGKKDNGYPALEKRQPLNRVGKQRFFLVSLMNAGRFQSVSSLSSIRPIEVQFVMKPKEQSVKEGRVFFCLCGGW